MLEVGDDVVDVLDANGQPHITIGNARRQLLFSSQLGMRRRRRMNCETPGVADIRHVVVKLQGINELSACLFATGKLEADKAAILATQIAVRALAMDPPAVAMDE